MSGQSRFVLYIATVFLFLEVLTGGSTVHASLCQITNVSHNYPNQVTASQQFSISTTVTGSCSAGDDYYYSVKAQVIDKSSDRILSVSRIRFPGYNASNFVVTLSDSISAPAEATAAWNIEIAVIVSYTTTTGLQDATSIAISDYATVGYATIQVGSYQPVPEFVTLGPLVLAFALAVAAVMSLRSRNERPVIER